jgi:hypothetical protein
MAAAAQIESNTRNAKRSTGPRTEAGEVMARLDALEHGERAGTVAPVLPQEDPAELESRIRQWVLDLRPGDAAQRKLVERAAKLSWDIDRADRCETARLARRVRRAQSRGGEKATGRVCELGRKLLFMAGPRILPTSGPAWDDNPAAFLRGLEVTAEGCRWLLERWRLLGDMLDCGVPWTLADLYRSVRLQGKHPVDAINDEDLNAQFLAWEVLEPEGAVDFWKRCYEMTPRVDPGFQGFMEWREFDDRPAGAGEAKAYLRSMIAGRVEGLEERIAAHAEIEGDDAIELADAASFDPGPTAEKLRRSQAARSRELRQTLELLLKLQAAAGKRKPPTTEGTEDTEERAGNDRKGVNEDNREAPTDRCGAAGYEAAKDRKQGKSYGEDRGSEQVDAEEATSSTREGRDENETRKRRGNAVRRPAIKRAELVVPKTAANEKGSDESTEGQTIQTIKTLVTKRFEENLRTRELRERTRFPTAEEPTGPGGQPAGHVAGPFQEGNEGVT